MNFLKTCALPKYLKLWNSSPFFQFLCIYIQYISSMAWFEMLWKGLLYALINYPLYEINGAFDRFDFFNLICTLPNIVWEVYSIYVPIGGQGRKVLNKDSTLNMDKISTCTYLPKSKCLVYELYSDFYAFSNETILYV